MARTGFEIYNIFRSKTGSTECLQEPEKPKDGLVYLKNTVGGAPADKETIAELRKENDALKAKVRPQ